MKQIIMDSIQSAEEDFITKFNALNSREQSNTVYTHILAVEVLFANSLYFKIPARTLIYALELLDSSTKLYSVLIAPYMKIVEDIDVIAKKYGAMYLIYLGEKSKGMEDLEIINNIFYSCEKLDFYASQQCKK